MIGFVQFFIGVAIPDGCQWTTRQRFVSGRCVALSVAGAMMQLHDSQVC
jgi:hypothetical protein